jgi:lipopolysaccharide export LptBFGC system permease protein LptF
MLKKGDESTDFLRSLGMKQFVVIGVVVMLAMLLGGVMLAENVFLGPMASVEPAPTEYEAAAEEEQETAADDNRRYAGYSGYNIIRAKEDAK